MRVKVHNLRDKYSLCASYHQPFWWPLLQNLEYNLKCTSTGSVQPGRSVWLKDFTFNISSPPNDFDGPPPKSKIQAHNSGTFPESAQVQDLCILEEVYDWRTSHSTFQPHPTILMTPPKSKIQVHNFSTFPENAQ